MIGSLVRQRLAAMAYGSDPGLLPDSKLVGTVVSRAIADRVMVLWNNGKTETIDPYYLEVIDV